MAIKTARELVLLPYTQRTVTERPGGRGGRDRGERTLGDAHGDSRPPRRSEGGGSDRGSDGNRDRNTGRPDGGTGDSSASSTGGADSSAGADRSAGGGTDGNVEAVGNAEMDGDVLAELATDIAAEVEEAGADA
jgi:hypothetical protein